MYAEGIEPIYVSDYDNKADVYAAARDMNREICEEGMVLLKNSEISAGKKALPLATPVSDTSVTARPKISVFGKNSVNIAYGGSARAVRTPPMSSTFTKRSIRRATT